MDGQMFEVKSNFLLINEHPNLVIVPMLHQVREKQECVPLTLLILAEDESIFLIKGKILGHLEPCPITIEEIIKEDWPDSEESGGEEENSKLPLEKKLITSPAEINTHRNREWVQKKLETLERAVVIVRSISPSASPIVIVPKKTEPGEPPRRRLCVDYRVINSLLPEVQKAHSKAKKVLTLVPLPQIDHIYASLRGSKIFSTFDLRSGYHHMELSLEARAKSAFVTPMDKFLSLQDVPLD